MPRYYTRASKLTGLAQIAAERGAALPPIMREVGIEPEVLRRPEVLIDYLGFCELLRRCALAWDLPDIGLRMVRYQRMDVLGPVALLTRMERTARGALRGDHGEYDHSCQRHRDRARGTWRIPRRWFWACAKACPAAARTPS